jgi:branched-chain amino acid transport system permease protein
MYILRRAWAELRNEVFVLPSRTLVLLWVLALMALPPLYGDAYVLRILTMTCIFAIFAASWDLLAGYTGQVNFGHALFFGAGAYTSGLMSLKLGISPWATLWAGAAVAMLFGYLAGYLCLRLRGSYLSLATLAFPLIALGLLFAFPDFSGGELGISGLQRLASTPVWNYYLAASSMLVIVFALWALADSKLGIVLHAIRDDEVAARASGINTPRYKLAVFALSGAAAGFAGALFAHYMRVAGPSTLEVALSFQVVIWGIFGGVATIYGPVAAVFLLYPLTEWLGSFKAIGELRLLIFAAIVLLVLIFMPRGLAPTLRDRIETRCSRCKQHNGAWRSVCRLCGAPIVKKKPLRLRSRLAAAKAADAVELDQSKVRLAINFILILYLLGTALWDGTVDPTEAGALAIMIWVAILSTAHLGWILARPGVNHLRRRTVVWLDMGAITLLMLLTGETGVMLYCIYPWVVIGNGFRYGRWYLHYAQAIAVGGFLAVFLLSAYWRQHAVLGASLLLVLLAIPWYVSLLLSRLHAARAEAEAANAAKTKFLAAASHDLRQPMQALSMYASVLEARVGDADALRVVHGVQLSVQTLERLFDSVLDISKIESGVVKPEVLAFPLMPLIDRVIEAEIPIAALKNLELRAVRTSAGVRSDPALLERMLKNLVTNAIRYTHRGGIVVGCRRRGGGQLRLEVVDSGAGIPLQEQERIFDEYYQLEGASAQGLGLGLPIVRSLGRLLGHRVTVRSAVGRGSVFAIELERALVAPALAAAGPPAAPSLLGVTVVLVDDDVEIRDSTRLLLESWGCRYIGGATLAEVEGELRERRLRPDALIVDYRLADAVTGVQVIERLRAGYGRNLPALVITGTPDAALTRQLAGIPLATKPIPPGKLRSFLSSIARPAPVANLQAEVAGAQGLVGHQ